MNFFYIKTKVENTVLEFTKSLIVGLIFTVTIFSFYKTIFMTINVLFAGVVVLYLTYERKKLLTRPKFNFNIKYLLYSILVSLIFLGIKYISTDFFNNKLVDIGLDDYYYYCKTAQIMQYYGIEGRNFTSVLDFTDLRKYNTPYHYFDLWVNAFFQNLNLISILEIYHFVFCPLIFTLCFFSFLSLVDFLKLGKLYLNIIIAFCCVFFAGCIPIKNLIGESIFTQPRTYCAYIFTILFFVDFLRCNYISSFTWLSLMTVCTILAAPPILTFIFLFGLFFYIKGNKSIFFYCFFLCFLILLLTVIQYVFFGSLNGSSNRAEPITMNIYLTKVLFSFFRENLFRLPFYYLILVIPVIFFLKKSIFNVFDNYIIYVSAIVMIILPILFSALFNFNIDAPSIISYPTHAMIICIFLFFISQSEIRAKIIYSSAFLLQSVVVFILTFENGNSVDSHHSYVSQRFLMEIDLRLSDGAVGSYVKSMKNPSIWDFNPFVVHGFHFIGFLNKRIDLVNLSDFKSKYSKVISSEIIENGEFNSFINSKGVQDDFYTNQRDFVDKRNIQFILTEAEGLKNPHLKKIVSDSLVDDYGGYRIYFFN
ncbi:MAG: hypothetical protein RL106_15 [Bacteroidota bacterium]|jgi:hypothetical protein